MPKGIYKRTKNHIDILIKRNKDPKHIAKVKKALTGHGFSDETLQKMRDNHADFSGSNNGRWKGGYYVNKNGYKYIYKPNHPLRNTKGYIREHLFILYKKLGDKIHKSNVIHHIDSNKTNNKIKNLMVMRDHGAHRRIHCNKTIDGDIVFDGRNL